ncbi:Hydrolase tropI [Psilocybe cubensis]|uniref:Hydrolase tropI n=2 Tax=Psilocybe cubensis TaxID=181762 RepID=A0ACB8GWR2_PSICU|nr:Hydrolase tropI [Psilocybe cubensis]KAH9480066.1 Hydrolase tropI [Psilocybe cubensis]
MSCPNCAKGDFLPGEPTGSIRSDFQNAYLAPAPEGDSSSYAVLLLTDAFGLPLKNCKIMADEMAKRLQCDVWISDYFNGRPLIPVNAMTLPDKPGVKLSTWDWIKFFFTVIPNIPTFISNRPSVTDRRVESLIHSLKEKKKYKSIGAVGYCFGGSTCVRFGGTGLVDSVVVVHPGKFSLDQVKAIKVPTAWACAEEDMWFPDTLRSAAEAEFASRKGKDNFVEYEFKEYKGTTHGFASRPNVSIPEAIEAHKAALDQTIEWFKKTLA